jgi:heme A synthase
MSLYTIALLVHSWLRWFALVAGVVATLAAIVDRSGGSRAAERWGLALMISLDLQMLIGLLLYLVLSPFTAQALRDFGAAMKSPGLRFFAVEHITIMFAAVILAHLGRVLARKASNPRAKRTRLIVCFGLATVLMIVGIPWPGMASGRPLFRV